MRSSHRPLNVLAKHMTRLCFTPVATMLHAASPPPVHAAAAASRRKVLVITGPTAVGKSATALSLCERLNGEIVSADSVQVYKNLDIGSNKASAQERAAVRHHLLDIADPAAHDFSAGDFFRAARAAIADIHARDRVPVVVGGTMMYVRWLIYGRPATPPAPEHAREKVDAAIRELHGDWDAAVALLAEKDPKRAARLSRNDWYRLGRALEIVETTGTAMTDMPLRGGAPNAQVDVQELDYDFRCVFLFGERVALNRRIDERCEEMILPRADAAVADWEQVFRSSVLYEVSLLLRTNGLRVAPASPSRAIGYRQTILYLVSRALAHAAGLNDLPDAADDQTAASAKAFRAFVEDFQAATRGYAKQQTSWFRKEEHFRWVNAGTGAVDDIENIVALSESEYNALRKRTQTAQADVRADMIAQGKLMKTYIGEKKWLKNGSEAEQQAVRLAERCARDMAQDISREELERIRDVLSG